ncbi:MAG TPA: hypothetical protein VEP90_27710 [Methylomirabilota bacterium]|nr:hypothetical protein [Methylomirabilota bacterium]
MVVDNSSIATKSPILRFSDAAERARTAADRLATIIESYNGEPHDGRLAKKRREDLVSENLALLATRYVIIPDEE